MHALIVTMCVHAWHLRNHVYNAELRNVDYVYVKKIIALDEQNEVHPCQNVIFNDMVYIS